MQLPEETKESTSAMRKAVSEQIKALKELSEIVSKSGRTFDVSDRRRRIEPPGGSCPASGRSPGRLRRSAADATARLARRARARRATGRRRLGGRDSCAALRKEEAPRAESRVQPQRSPLQMVESLNSLSVDIARAIDHEASVELWDRYRKGERNVFTRRLYTLKGQQTFDDIRRKYQNDGEFRGAVDRYCQDFEKLLATSPRTTATT